MEQIDWNALELGSNFICICCFSTVVERSQALNPLFNCKSCYIKSESIIVSQGNFRQNSILDITDSFYHKELIRKYNEEVKKINEKFKSSITDLTHYKNSLTTIVKKSVEERIADLDRHEAKIMQELDLIQAEIEKDKYNIHIDTSKKSGKIAMKLMNDGDLPLPNLVIFDKFELDKIQKLVNSAITLEFTSEQSLYCEPVIDLLAPGQKVLTRIYLNSHYRGKISVNAEKHWVKGANWMNLNSDILFCCGGRGEALGLFSVGIDESWVISLAHGSKYITQTTSCSKRRYHGMENLNGKIYVFGGFTTSCQSFAPETFKWENLANMPRDIGKVSSTKYENYILLCGETSRDLYKYTLEKNTFEIIKTPLAQNSSKMIFHTSTMCICFSEDNIYKADMGGVNWSLICKHQIGLHYWGPSESKVVEKFLYFTTENGYLWRLKLFPFSLSGFEVDLIDLID